MAQNGQQQAELGHQGAQLLCLRASFFVGALLLTILPTAFVRAQEDRGLTIAPLVFELNANPGEALAEQIRITNRSDATLTVTPEVRDFTPTGETGEVNILADENETYSLRAWTTVTPSSITLAPLQTQTVTFTIRVPLNAEPGGHYGSILASAGGVGPEGTGIAIAQKVGTLVLLRVSGDAKENLTVREFSAPTFLERGPVSFTARFANEGNVHVRPAGFITITNFWGKEVAKIDLEQKNVIPGSVRKIEPKWEIAGGLGRYTATLTAVYGSTQQNLAATTSFWIFPWKIGVPIGVVGLLVLVYAIRRRSRLAQALRVLFGRS